MYLVKCELSSPFAIYVNCELTFISFFLWIMDYGFNIVSSLQPVAPLAQRVI
jgi:hypothetical protein